MANIYNQVIPVSGDIGRIYGLAGYYSECDKMQHVVVATTDATLHELHWNWQIHPFSYQTLLHSSGSAPVQISGIHSLSGFYTSDDNYQHVIVATGDGLLQEVYFTDPQQVRVRSPLFQLPTTAGPHIGQAGFYNFDNNLRTVTVGGEDSVLYEVTWNAQVTPSATNLLNHFTLSDVASIAGFFDLSFLSGGVPFMSENIIVAMKTGEVYDVRTEGAVPGGVSQTTELVTTFASPLVNVASFVESDTHCRHVIALHASGQLYDYSYTPQQNFGQTPLVSFPNVADIVAYYSAYDSMCHVIVGTDEANGKLHEVYYNLRV
jgi:hypothetical protein